jgi:dihydrofolate reductase
MSDRRVVANMSLTLDGRYAGPGGALDLGWVMPYAVSNTSRDHLTGLWEPATTALLGRVNAEGFLGYWPTVIGAPGTDPRDEGFAKWLVETEKVVLSRTLTQAPWERARLVDAPVADVVADLRGQDGGDILVLSSASVIRQLLAADLVDRLSLMFFPELLGGGARLLEDGLPASKWSLAAHRAGEHGELSLAYDRIRAGA